MSDADLKRRMGLLPPEPSKPKSRLPWPFAKSTEIAPATAGETSVAAD